MNRGFVATVALAIATGLTFSLHELHVKSTGSQSRNVTLAQESVGGHTTEHMPLLERGDLLVVKGRVYFVIYPRNTNSVDMTADTVKVVGSRILYTLTAQEIKKAELITWNDSTYCPRLMQFSRQRE